VDVGGLVRDAFGPDARVAGCAELAGGTFNEVYGVDLADGRRRVLKVGPPPARPVLTYERDLIAAEALFYRRAGAAGLPVPEVCHVGRYGAREVLFVTRLPGTLLTEAGAGPAVHRELGRLAAALHAAPPAGGWFGYPRRDGRTRAARWSASFAAMVDDILADAVFWDVQVPDGIAGIVARHRAVLDAVRRPALVHFDLWDGNVLVDGGRVSGIVDGERCFYGDPLAELVSMALLRDVDEVPDVLAGYAARAGRPLVLDGAVRVRLALYTAYLYLIMIVEGPSRGYGGERRDAFVARLRGLLAAQLARL
jgi:aminoglycoside phosphotransferase (APT) family kinase protein